MFPNFLTLRELEAGTCAALTVFLALFFAGISGEKACCLDKGTSRIVNQSKRAGHAVTNGAGLTGNAAAFNGSYDVELANNLGSLESIVHEFASGVNSKIILEIATIDGDFAGARFDDNAGAGSFTTTGSRIAIGEDAVVDNGGLDDGGAFLFLSCGIAHSGFLLFLVKG